MFGRIRRRRRASTHGEDGGACGGWGGGSGILDCLHAMSEVGVEEKRREALESSSQYYFCFDTCSHSHNFVLQSCFNINKCL